MANKSQKDIIKEVVLSSGEKVVIKEGKGKDLFWAYRNAADPSEIVKLLMVRLIEIDGEPLTEDGIDELPISDVMALIKEFTEVYSPLSQQK
jgi:predicted house-cleaning noncanonical NTP pyrophosphatase (MazG superfamily)